MGEKRELRKLAEQGRIRFGAHAMRPYHFSIMGKYFGHIRGVFHHGRISSWAHFIMGACHAPLPFFVNGKIFRSHPGCIPSWAHFIMGALHAPLPFFDNGKIFRSHPGCIPSWAHFIMGALHAPVPPLLFFSPVGAHGVRPAWNAPRLKSMRHVPFFDRKFLKGGQLIGPLERSYYRGAIKINAWQRNKI